MDAKQPMSVFFILRHLQSNQLDSLMSKTHPSQSSNFPAVALKKVDEAIVHSYSLINRLRH
jgi:hypothetical protein